jgi:hypothetical protein
MDRQLVRAFTVAVALLCAAAVAKEDKTFAAKRNYTMFSARLC